MWFSKIKSDISNLPDRVDFYTKELDDSLKETKLSGSLEKQSQDLPGIVSHRFNQLQEIESILKHLEIRYNKIRSDHYKRYLERYNRELSDRSIEKYLDGEKDIIDMNDIINEVAYLRNKYLGVIKGFEIKGYQINNIVKLRSVGIDTDLTS